MENQLILVIANDDLKHYVPIEVESLLNWAESREDYVNPSICMVPSIFRDISPDSFKPRLVSIGPLHKEDPNVQDIERLKRAYLHDLLQRPTTQPNQPKTKLENCLQKVNAKIGEIRSSYSSTTKYSDAQLANMMVMDGCFILEFCLKDKELKDKAELKDKELKDDDSKLIDSKDKEPTLLSTRIAIDLMLLENQIPFFVLKDIFDLTKPDSISLSLTSLLHQVLLNYAHPFETFPEDKKIHDDFPVPNYSSDPEHVLNCLHKIYQSKIVDDCRGMCDVPWLKLICKHVWNMFELCSCSDKVNACHSAVELKRSGVKFKPQKEKQKGMSINFAKAPSYVLGFWRKRTLEMPILVIEDFTEVVLRNFIAYEQFFLKENYFFTSYSFFMDNLINDAADVGNLVESGVLINLLGSHKEAATVINSICKNINVDQFYYEKQIQELDEYYNSFWPNSFANLRRTYFNNPWSVFALLGAIALFGLTVVQTIYTVMSFYP